MYILNIESIKPIKFKKYIILEILGGGGGRRPPNHPQLAPLFSNDTLVTTICLVIVNSSFIKIVNIIIYISLEGK